jgi:hypothetical protein
MATERFEERRHQSDFRTKQKGGKPWWEGYGAIIASIGATMLVISSAFSFYEVKLHDPHINDLIDLKQKDLYLELKETNAKLAINIEQQNRIFYMLLRHLSPKEKECAAQDFALQKQKEERESRP